MNELFDGKILCSANPTDCYWLDVLYEAAGIEPTFGVRPLETFIGREPATKALALRPAFRDHRALGDVRALEACVSHYLQEGSRSMKSEEIKKNNHYVWAHYLRGWAENGRDVYRKTKKGVELYSVRGVACEPHFYRITPLDDQDVEFIQVWLDKADEHLRAFHYKMLEKMIYLSCAIEVLDREDQAHKRELLLANTLENIHTTVENDFRPILDSLRKGDLSVLKSAQNRNNLHSYIGHQFARTKFLRDTFIDSWSHAGDEYVRIAKKTWWFMSLVYGVNVSFNLDRFYYRKNVVWLVNKTKTPFLTSDHPVISVHPSVVDTSSGPPPDHSDFYFPISPTVAYMVNDSEMYGRGVMEATEECVELLNRNMLLRCGQTVFGSTAAVVQNTKRPKQKTA